ncbi:zinc finger protein 3-like [Ischnura elegans]|uniref:zinc finger protein 3-like n=1 Tax=Ischnura elegans TaxID=197161 RepID=UPI001ED87579|nr:zinc finger protein 3-like [Ischnura elegans]
MLCWLWLAVLPHNQGGIGSPSVKSDLFSDDGGGYALNASNNDLVFQASDQAKALTSSQGEEVDAKGTGGIVTGLDSMQVLAKKELSPKEADATEPTDTEDGELVLNPTMAIESMTEAEESAFPERASALFAGNNNVRELRRSFIVDGKSCTGSPHIAKKPYSCGECDNSFSRKDSLIRHTRTHRKGKPYSCNECDKSFSNNSHLVKHPCLSYADSYKGETLLLQSM